MNREFDFNGHNFEIPVQPIDKNLDLGSEQVINSMLGTVAKNFSERYGRVGAEVNDSKSIIFQQNMAEDLSAISEDKKKVEDFWNKYEKDVSVYIEEVGRSRKKKTSSEDTKKIREYFNGLKRSVLGSLAVTNFFEGQGFQTEFPSVEEDMKEKCDLKFVISNDDGKEVILAVQVKSGHLARISREEEKEIIERLILTSVEKLKGKDQKDFRTLKMYCSSLSGSSKTYLPVFVNIPVTRSIGKNFISESGKINETLQKAMEVKWGEAKKNFGVDLNVDKDR